jgi:hypothetical protein
MHRHDHAISGVDELLRLDPKMLEGLRIVSQEPQHSFWPCSSTVSGKVPDTPNGALVFLLAPGCGSS